MDLGMLLWCCGRAVLTAREEMEAWLCMKGEGQPLGTAVEGDGAAEREGEMHAGGGSAMGELCREGSSSTEMMWGCHGLRTGEKEMCGGLHGQEMAMGRRRWP